MELIVKTDEIKERGLELKRELPAAEVNLVLRAEPPTGFTTSVPARLDARISRVGEHDLVFAGKLHVDASCECSRCLDPVPVPIPVDFTVALVREGDLPGQGGEDDGEEPGSTSFDPAEADLITYTGRRVDLWPAIREQLLLALPMVALCREDCQGLCQVCGRNLNDGACTCERSVPDPRWSVLRNLKLQDS